jgi:hypothetical protein
LEEEEVVEAEVVEADPYWNRSTSRNERFKWHGSTTGSRTRTGR